MVRLDANAVEAESEQTTSNPAESSTFEPINNEFHARIDGTECEELTDRVQTISKTAHHQHHTSSPQPDGKVNRTNVTTIATNGIGNLGSQGTAQILKLIDGNAIIMRPSTSTHVVATKPLVATAKSPANLFVSKAVASPQSFVTLKASSLEYVSMPNSVRPSVKTSRIHTITPEASGSHGASTQVLSTASNHIVSIPASTTVTTSAMLRGSTFMKSGEKQRIVHTVSPNFIDTRTVKRLTSHEQYPPKYVSKAGTAIHLKPKTVTIHPGTTFTRGKYKFHFCHRFCSGLF